MAATSIVSLPDETLLAILEMGLASDLEMQGRKHYFHINDESVHYQHLNSQGLVRTTTRMWAQPLHVIFRSVCRKWRYIANLRPIVVDVLVNKHNKNLLMQSIQSYPHMPPNVVDNSIKTKSYWESALATGSSDVSSASEISKASEMLAEFWTAPVKVCFRLFFLSWNYASKITPSAAGYLDSLCIGYPSQRAAHMWKDSCYKLSRDLGCRSVHVWNLRTRASRAMQHPTVKNKTPVDMCEAMAVLKITCTNLVWEFMPPYAGNGSDLEVCVPRYQACLALTSGRKGVAVPNFRTDFFCKNWDISGLANADTTFKNGCNARAATELVLQHIIIGDFDKFLEFFPKLRKVRVYTNVYIRNGNDNLESFSSYVVREVMHGLCDIECYKMQGSFNVY